MDLLSKLLESELSQEARPLLLENSGTRGVGGAGGYYTDIQGTGEHIADCLAVIWGGKPDIALSPREGFCESCL